MTSKLRIVTWNCNMALRLKFDRLLSLQPDVAVVQECADPDGANGWRPDCAAYDWIGFNPDKGLGIFTFGDLALTRHPGYSETYALYLPVVVSGWCRFNLLGLWAADPRKIPAGATNDPVAALQHYRSFLSSGPAVVAGDFNRLPQQMSVRRNDPGSSVVDALAGAGLIKRRLRHERCLGPAGAAPHPLPPAQVFARLRGRLHFHPRLRGRPSHRVRGGRSARLDHLERSCAAGRRVQSGPWKHIHRSLRARSRPCGMMGALHQTNDREVIRHEYTRLHRTGKPLRRDQL